MTGKSRPVSSPTPSKKTHEEPAEMGAPAQGQGQQIVPRGQRAKAQQKVGLAHTVKHQRRRHQPNLCRRHAQPEAQSVVSGKGGRQKEEEKAVRGKNHRRPPVRLRSNHILYTNLGQKANGLLQILERLDIIALSPHLGGALFHEKNALCL